MTSTGIPSVSRPTSISSTVPREQGQALPGDLELERDFAERVLGVLELLLRRELLVTQLSQPIATPVELLQLDLAQFDGAARLDQFDRCRVGLDFEQRLTPMDVLA